MWGLHAKQPIRASFELIRRASWRSSGSSLMVALMVVLLGQPASVVAADGGGKPNRLMALEPAAATAAGAKKWVAERVSALEDVLERSGLDVEAMIERVDGDLSTGQGGPLVPALGRDVPAVGGADLVPDPVRHDRGAVVRHHHHLHAVIQREGLGMEHARRRRPAAQDQGDGFGR